MCLGWDIDKSHANNSRVMNVLVNFGTTLTDQVGS